MRKSYTIIELITVLAFFAVVMILGPPMYRNTLEKAKVKVCQMNQRVLLQAVELYGSEHSILPDSLNQLNSGSIQQAWAVVLGQENTFIVKTAYYLVDWESSGLAYAQEAGSKRYVSGQLTFFTCPADITPPPGGISYSLNERFRNMSMSSYNSIKKSEANTVVIADGNAPAFAMLDECDHRHHRIGLFSKAIYALGGAIGAGRFERVEMPVQTGSSGKARLIKDNGSLSDTEITVAVPVTATYGNPRIEALKNKLIHLEEEISGWRQKAGKLWTAIEENLADDMRQIADKANTMIKDLSLGNRKRDQDTTVVDSLEALSGQLRMLEQKIDERLKTNKR